MTILTKERLAQSTHSGEEINSAENNQTHAQLNTQKSSTGNLSAWKSIGIQKGFQIQNGGGGGNAYSAVLNNPLLRGLGARFAGKDGLNAYVYGDPAKAGVSEGLGVQLPIKQVEIENRLIELLQSYIYKIGEMEQKLSFDVEEKYIDKSVGVIHKLLNPSSDYHRNVAEQVFNEVNSAQPTGALGNPEYAAYDIQRIDQTNINSPAQPYLWDGDKSLEKLYMRFEGEGREKKLIGIYKVDKTSGENIFSDVPVPLIELTDEEKSMVRYIPKGMYLQKPKNQPGLSGVDLGEDGLAGNGTALDENTASDVPLGGTVEIGNGYGNSVPKIFTLPEIDEIYRTAESRLVAEGKLTFSSFNDELERLEDGDRLLIGKFLQSQSQNVDSISGLIISFLLNFVGKSNFFDKILPEDKVKDEDDLMRDYLGYQEFDNVGKQYDYEVNTTDALGHTMEMIERLRAGELDIIGQQSDQVINAERNNRSSTTGSTGATRATPPAVTTVLPSSRSRAGSSTPIGGTF